MAFALGSTVVITGRSTSSGYSLTWSSLFDTLTTLESMSEPVSNSSITSEEFSELSLSSLLRPVIPLSSSSCSFTTSLSISKGLAPLQKVLTVTLSVSTSGVS